MNASCNTNRFKERGHGRIRGQTELWYQPHTGDPYMTSSWAPSIADEAESMTGVNLCDYSGRLARKELLPLTPFYHGYYSWKASGDIRTETNYTDGNTSASYYAVGAGETPQHGIAGKTRLKPSDLELYASVKEYDKLAQAAAAGIYSTGYDALTFVAELHKVAGLFRNFVRQVISLIKNGKVPRADKMWLEGRYGWRILYYDMKSIEELIRSIGDEASEIVRRHASSGRVERIVTDYPISGATYEGNIEVTQVIEIKHRGTVAAKYKPSAVVFNPALTAWELMTFSFVIDWIIAIGQWIESLSFLAVQQEHFAAGGYYITATGIGHVSNLSWLDSPYSDRSYGGHLWSNCNSYAYIKRRVPTSVSLIPQMEIDLDLPKVLDLVALATSLFIRRK